MRFLSTALWTMAWLMFWTFLGLKLSGAWSTDWLWVTSPLWIAGGITLLMLSLVLVVLSASDS